MHGQLPGLLVVFALSSLALMAQAPEPASRPGGVVRGVVVDGGSGTPLRRAQVAVSLATAGVRPVLTDDKGAFVITVPGGGTPTLRVTKAGFAPALVPPRIDGAVEVRMTRSSSISGRVIDRAGMPVPRILVHAHRETREASSTAPPQASASTDERGEFRIGGLAAGRYVVTVVQAPSMPSARDPDAFRQFADRLRDGGLEQPLKGLSDSATLDVRVGDSIGGIDFLVGRRECNWALNPPRPEDTGTAVVEGRVLGPSGPLDCMLVRMTQPGVVRIRSTATDADGRFSFPRLSAGTYTLQAVGWGYVQRDYGQQTARQPARLVTVRDGDEVNGLVIDLPLISAVTGAVRDEYGEPAEGVQIQAFEVRVVDGRQVAMDAGPARASTDDRGMFRLFPLTPGPYVISATRSADVSGGTDAKVREVSHPVYYPGTFDSSQADPIQVDIGRDVEGVDFALTRSAAGRIAGVAVTPDARPLTGLVRLATSQRSGALIMPSRTTAIDAEGAFAFTDVPAGDYVIQAVGRGTPGDFGLEHVRLGEGESVNVRVTAFRGSTIEGRLVREGGDEVPASRFALASVAANLDFSTTAGRRPLNLPVQEDGSFRAAGLSGPVRFALLTAPDGWYLKSVSIDGIEAADSLFDFGFEGRSYRDVQIVVSGLGGRLVGRAVDRGGDSLPDYSVIAYSVDRDHWFTSSSRVRLVRAQPDGSFLVAGLPPGEYLVVAVNRLDGPPDAGRWRHPDALANLSASAQRLKVAEGQTLTTTLRLAAGDKP